MCNIAGYAGKEKAAPILLEMLRRQQPYDGDVSTCVATIYEGKLHYRAIVGNVDALIRETDVLELPGTIGIAHSRPSGKKNESPFQPAISKDGKIALITNGTTPMTKYSNLWDEAVDMLDQNGYVFAHEKNKKSHKSPKLSRNEHYVSPVEARAFLVEHYLKQGQTIEQAMAISCAHMYSDNVSVMIHEDHPDEIYVLRTTRPIVAVVNQGETYMATTRFGLPEGLGNRAFDLPLFHTCVLRREGVTVTGTKMEMEPVSDMTPYTYKEAYKRFETLLSSPDNPLYFDALEFAANEMRDLWADDHTLVQHARLVYDMLWQFDREGRLKRDLRTQVFADGTRQRYYFWLE